MLIAYAPFIVCIIGALLYGLCEGKLSKTGEYMFFAGLLVTLMSVANHTIKIP